MIPVFDTQYSYTNNIAGYTYLEVSTNMRFIVLSNYIYRRIDGTYKTLNTLIKSFNGAEIKSPQCFRHINKFSMITFWINWRKNATNK